MKKPPPTYNHTRGDSPATPCDLCKPDRERGLQGRWHRLPERVCFAAALWILPSVLAMTPGQTQLVREASVSVLVTSIAAWVARQGKRRSELVNGNGGD